MYGTCGRIDNKADIDFDLNVCGAVARYYDISSKADRGEIFIRAAAGQIGALSRILLMCPLPQILWKF